MGLSPRGFPLPVSKHGQWSLSEPSPTGTATLTHSAVWVGEPQGVSHWTAGTMEKLSSPGQGISFTGLVFYILKMEGSKR